MEYFVYTIELFDEKQQKWHTDTRYYRGFKDSMEFDVIDIKDKRRNFKFIGKKTL